MPAHTAPLHAPPAAPRFNCAVKFTHDITVDQTASLSVFSQGTGVDLNADQHRAGPHANLFSSIYVGANTRPFESSGRQDRGAHTGRGTTFWNLAGRTRPTPPTCDFGPLLNFVGSYAASSTVRECVLSQTHRAPLRPWQRRPCRPRLAQPTLQLAPSSPHLRSGLTPPPSPPSLLAVCCPGLVLCTAPRRRARPLRGAGGDAGPAAAQGRRCAAAPQRRCGRALSPTPCRH